MHNHSQLGGIPRIALALAAVGLCATAALAQNTNAGDIRGIVTDSTGAVVPEAT